MGAILVSPFGTSGTPPLGPAARPERHVAGLERCAEFNHFACHPVRATVGTLCLARRPHGSAHPTLRLERPRLCARRTAENGWRTQHGGRRTELDGRQPAPTRRRMDATERCATRRGLHASFGGAAPAGRTRRARQRGRRTKRLARHARLFARHTGRTGWHESTRARLGSVNRPRYSAGDTNTNTWGRGMGACAWVLGCNGWRPGRDAWAAAGSETVAGRDAGCTAGFRAGQNYHGLTAKRGKPLPIKNLRPFAPAGANGLDQHAAI